LVAHVVAVDPALVLLLPAPPGLAVPQVLLLALPRLARVPVLALLPVVVVLVVLEPLVPALALRAPAVPVAAWALLVPVVVAEPPPSRQ
jgi:hypothetical protein